MAILDGLKGVISGAQEKEIKKLTLNENHCSTMEDEYEVVVSGDDITVSRYIGSWRFTDEDREKYLDKRVSGKKELKDKINTALIRKIKIPDWSGFMGSDPNVLDGTSFRFEAVLSDDTKIFANGTNAYPKGYPELVELLRGIVDP